MKTDILIAGAGPAGLFAAITAAQSGAKVVIVESNTTPARKLLLTGGGRCNLTHAGSIDDFVKAYDFCGRFLRHCLYEFPADKLRKYFAANGLQTKTEKDGCVFPITEKAADVADVLIRQAKKLSVEFLYDKKITSIEKSKTDFITRAGNKKIFSKAVIIATGGVSWPKTGSAGDGYKFAKNFGHTIIEPKPALIDLITAEKWPSKLKGVGVDNVIIKTKIQERKIAESGALMFTANGIGGPAALNVSRLIADFLPNFAKPIKITIDLAPQYNNEQLNREIISLCSQNPKKELINVLTIFLRKALVVNLCSQINLPAVTLAGALGKRQRLQLVKKLKQLELSIAAASPIAKATITRGGVEPSEINRQTMESKLCSGLFFAGEVINADGPCGGFNLQIAFSTAFVAGKQAAQKLCKTSKK